MGGPHHPLAFSAATAFMPPARYVTIAPVDAYGPNGFGLYNTVGNVWEWVDGGTREKRLLRGSSYVDTIDGSANHALRVSTRMENTADSGGHNTGFRCARSLERPKKKKGGKAKKPKKLNQPKQRSDL